MSRDSKRLEALEQFASAVMNGAFVQPTAVGPNKLNKNTIKAKSITGSMIDVSNLSAVQTKTGSLTVDGVLTIGTGGSLVQGKTGYTDTINAGVWLGLDSGVAKLRMGNAGHTQGIAYDGSTLAITGTVTATTGVIGGWTIGSTDLTSDAGATGMASSGAYRLWIGHATPGSAPFRVSSAGSLTAVSGSIGGWTADTVGLRLGSGASERGIDTGSTTFYSGGSPGTAPFRVTSAGALTATNATITGAITATSGTFSGNLSANTITGAVTFSGGSIALPGSGSITSSGLDINSATFGGVTVDGTVTLGSGGKIIDADGSYWDQTGITLKNSGGYGDAIKWEYTSTAIASAYASSTSFLIERSGQSIIQMANDNSIDLLSYGANGHYISVDNTNINLYGALKWGNITTGGGSNSDVALPGDAGLDVVVSVDNGATLAFVPLRHATVNINGTNRKVLYVL